MKHNKIAFEAEFMITDENGKEVSEIEWVSTNRRIIEILTSNKWKKYGEYVLELDSCQVEINSSQAFTSYSEAMDEMLHSYENLDEVVTKEFWLMIWKKSTPTKGYQWVTTSWIPRYKSISQVLQNSNVRASTNITGIHTHIDTDPQTHLKISQKVREIFIWNDFDTLWISEERLTHMKWVVHALQEVWIFSLIAAHHDITPVSSDTKFFSLIDADWNPLDSYSLVALKKPSGKIFTTELRTPDCYGDIDFISKQMRKAVEIITQS